MKAEQLARIKKKWNEAKELFLNNNREAHLELEFFHAFRCPVTLAEAMVKEHIVEDYEALELLVLRLYDIGFRDPETLSSLSGMKTSIIERTLENEINVYEHIDRETGEVTELGRQTLKDNESMAEDSTDSMKKHVAYLTPRRLQIESVTGTVIPKYLEDRVFRWGKDEKSNSKYYNMDPYLKEGEDGIVPRRSASYDEELRREINERIKEYRKESVLNEGDIILSVETLEMPPEAKEIWYREAYVTRYKGMRYPMIALRGFRRFDKMSVQSGETDKKGEHVVIPLSVAESDDEYLRRNGISFKGTLTRADHLFEYLDECVRSFRLHFEEEISISEDETPEESVPEWKITDNETSEEGNSNE